MELPEAVACAQAPAGTDIDSRPMDQDLGHTGLIFHEDHDLKDCGNTACQRLQCDFLWGKGRKETGERKKREKARKALGRRREGERRRETRRKCEIGMADWGW